MRRSAVVQLTLLPMLASAAVASADIADDPPSVQSLDVEPVVSPPGMTQPFEPVLAPPGMTPSITELDCDDDPSWRLRPDCADDADYGGVVIRGGFGNYFWTGGG